MNFNSFHRLLYILRVIPKLGYFNVILILFHRVLLKIRFILNPAQKQNKRYGNIFSTSNSTLDLSKRKNFFLLRIANQIIKGEIVYYSKKTFKVGSPPNWFLNPYNNKQSVFQNIHWSKIKDFNNELGDIKNIWEVSRFEWIGTLAIAYKLNLDKKILETINMWVNNWIYKNPINIGPNWKCGQEASIRLINIIIANQIIGNNKINGNLHYLIAAHLKRISSTTFYATAQNNNHIISESIALLLGGFILNKYYKNTGYEKFYKKGRTLLDKNINKLILEDGSFAQYSIVYHRMMLDLVCVVEIFRGMWGFDELLNKSYKKIKLAVIWYADIIDPVSGNAPNIGPNDGTYLFNYGNLEYRNFTPTLSLCSKIFNFKPNFKIKEKHLFEHIFDLNLNNKYFDSTFKIPSYKKSFLKLSTDKGMAILRAPRYKFRPHHSDGLHLDVWQNGINYVRGSGSYSYAAETKILNQFSGTLGQSTIVFDNQNQMPRISRFLFGSWLKQKNTNYDIIAGAAQSEYTNYKNVNHYRSLKKINEGWEISDYVKGRFQIAVLQFILAPIRWSIKDNSIINKDVMIKIKSDVDFNLNLIEKDESLYYMEKTLVPVLQVSFLGNAKISSKIIFKN